MFKGKEDKDFGDRKEERTTGNKSTKSKKRGQHDDVITGYNTGFFKFFVPQGSLR